MSNYMSYSNMFKDISDQCTVHQCIKLQWKEWVMSMHYFLTTCITVIKLSS